MNQLVIGIPGPWEKQADVIGAIARANDLLEEPRFLALGPLIRDMATDTSFGFQVYDQDPGLTQAFEYAGQGRFAAEELKAISEHKLSVYIICDELSGAPSRKNLDAARSLLRLGVHMLNAGGFAVKVEHSGVAHTADRWRYYANQNTILSLYDAFVTMVGGDDYNYTCGMHAFGLPDVSLTTEVSIDEAPYVMNAFNQRQLLESLEPIDGTLFTTGLGDPLLTTSHCSYGYDGDDLLNNPFGRWHLALSNEAASQGSAKFQVGGEPLFIAMNKEDKELKESIGQARESLPWFIRHFQSPYEYGDHVVKTLVRDGEESAYLWSVLVDVTEDGLLVELFETPPEFVNYEKGRRLLLNNDDVFDWKILRNGALTGGFSYRLQRGFMSPEDRRQLDLYSGVVSLVPTGELFTTNGYDK